MGNYLLHISAEKLSRREKKEQIRSACQNLNGELISMLWINIRFFFNLPAPVGGSRRWADNHLKPGRILSGSRSSGTHSE